MHKNSRLARRPVYLLAVLLVTGVGLACMLSSTGSEVRADPATDTPTPRVTRTARPTVRNNQDATPWAPFDFSGRRPAYPTGVVTFAEITPDTTAVHFTPIP